MRSFSDIESEAKLAGESLLATEYWKPSEPGDAKPFADLGTTVKRFKNPADVATYVSLLEEAHLWVHRDARAWLVLSIEQPIEIGTDFVTMQRRAGTVLRNFYPELTDDPVDPPVDRLDALHAALATLCEETETTAEKFLAEVVRRRIDERNVHVVYDQTEKLFYIEDLDPTREELDAWRPLSDDAH